VLPSLWRRTFTPPPVDLVHASGLPLDSIMLAGLRVAQRRGVPYLTTPLIHFGRGGGADAAETARFYQRPHQQRILRESTVVFVQSRAEADFVAAQGVPRERLQLLGMGIDPDALQGGVAERFRERVGFSEPFVLHVAGKALAKGSADMVEAMKRLWAQGCPAKLVLLGRSMNDFVRYFAPQEEALRGRCFDLGFVDEETKKDALAACTLFAMPSKADSFGIVYLEAWFYGKPVLGARAGGVPDLIEPGRDGLLVEFGDVPALAAALDHLLRNPDEAARLGECGRQKVLAHYTWNHKYALLRETYERCVGRSAHR
jgi:glycosyltransferase involved in cell wall biosynthesis